LAAAKSLCELGAKVFVSDIQAIERLEKALDDIGLLDKVGYEAGGHTDRVLEAEFIVLSPGVRTDIPILIKAEELGIPIYSEIEIAYRISRGKRLVITGSNGKTTTTTLLAEFCEKQFESVFLGGNIGIPMMNFAAKTMDSSVQVLEVSSFQLETISKFTPDIAIITNFFENHLDRYPSYKAYKDAKRRIALNMDEKGYLILNADQPDMHELAREVKCKVAWFGWDLGELKPSVYVKDKVLFFRDENGLEKELFKTSCAKIMGSHNIENIMAASLAAILAGVEYHKLQAVVENFTGVEHRLEWVRERNGVTYINDSKGTNCKATVIALKACGQPLILIAGGRDKGTDLSEWVETLRKHSKGVILYGEARQRFRSALEGLVDIKVATSFENAVELAADWAVSGDTVLLSPSCSSYDLFPNFEVRGQKFKDLVMALD
jgi:UDP-N-acetylmuramoylalanine--D-glutamate ligase